MADLSPPQVPLGPSGNLDKVLVIGATGHVGRIFLEQGLALFPNAEFRVLIRDMKRAAHFPEGVVCRPGDVRDVESIRAACDGLTPESLIFDSVTNINLSLRDDRGFIRAINYQGVENVITVARELGLTLHKAHSIAGIPCPKTGEITERTQVAADEEESVYATLPYLVAKKEATERLREAQANGLRLTFSYLPTPLGPRSRKDALVNGLIATFAKTRLYVDTKGAPLAYIDVRDAAKVHWLAFMNGVYDDFILSDNISKEAFVDTFRRITGVHLRTVPIGAGPVLALGRTLDVLKKWARPGLQLPLSEASARLMFANMSYSSAKASRLFGYETRPITDTLTSHFADLARRGFIRSPSLPEPPSIW